jgi:hypothetical protein
MEINGVAGNADHMKQKNRSVVLNVIRIHGPISKAELAEKTKLTFATISNIISELFGRRIVSGARFRSRSASGPDWKAAESQPPRSIKSSGRS